MPQFDVILLYDLGNGLRVDRGGEKFKEWPPIQMNAELPRQPRPAVELVTRFLRYFANLARLNRGKIAVGAIVESTHPVAPAVPRVLNYDLTALAFLFWERASSAFFPAQAVFRLLFAEH